MALIIKYTGDSDLYEQILDPTYQALFESHTFDGEKGTMTLISGVYAIPSNCFYRYDFDTMELPDGIVSIGAVAFSDATLTEITLPASMRSISLSFNRCENLTKATCYATTPPELAPDSGENGNFQYGEVLYVPKDSINAYRNTLWGVKFEKILAIPEPKHNTGFNFDGMIDTDYMWQLGRPIKL